MASVRSAAHARHGDATGRCDPPSGPSSQPVVTTAVLDAFGRACEAGHLAVARRLLACCELAMDAEGVDDVARRAVDRQLMEGLARFWRPRPGRDGGPAGRAPGA
jgi:hypothetical protein